MPTNRNKRTRKVLREPWVLEFLLFGRVLRPDGRPSCRPYLFGGPPYLRPDWESVRGEIMPAWIRERPGTRPWGWWVFDRPEPRPEGESEIDYLVRHGLLSPEEYQLLDRGPGADATGPNDQVRPADARQAPLNF